MDVTVSIHLHHHLCINVFNLSVSIAIRSPHPNTLMYSIPFFCMHACMYLHNMHVYNYSYFPNLPMTRFSHIMCVRARIH